eukprot:scaffold256_cov261-Pinguiococcus_pyrenoidosus.AAC.11
MNYHVIVKKGVLAVAVGITTGCDAAGFGGLVCCSVVAFALADELHPRGRPSGRDSRGLPGRCGREHPDSLRGDRWPVEVRFSSSPKKRLNDSGLFHQQPVLSLPKDYVCRRETSQASARCSSTSPERAPPAR